MDFTPCQSELMPEGVLTLFTIGPIWCIRYFAGPTLLLPSQSRSHREYLIPADNIIVFDRYYNFTNKFNTVRFVC